jgi:hypothetical protein
MAAIATPKLSRENVAKLAERPVRPEARGLGDLLEPRQHFPAALRVPVSAGEGQAVPGTRRDADSQPLGGLLPLQCPQHGADGGWHFERPLAPLGLEVGQDRLPVLLLE